MTARPPTPQRFLAEHAEAKRKGSTARGYRRLLDHVILPALGKKRVADVTRQDVARVRVLPRTPWLKVNYSCSSLATT